MQRERYPGEAVCLKSFLIGLRPVVEREHGSDSLFLHALRRALRSGALADLRRARQMFNLLPRESKRRLSDALVVAARERRGSATSPGPGPWITFDGGASCDRRTSPAIGLGRPDEGPEHGLRVLVRPGTLPTVAAETLRRIAGLIERDRRLLSDRFWFGAGGRDAGGDGC